MKRILTLLAVTVIGSCFIKVNAQYSWSQLKNFDGNPRYGAVSFVIGDTAYVGLGRNGTTYFNDFWKYNPSTETWTKIADFIGGARSNAVAFTLNNKGYVTTGVNGSTKYKDLWEYNPETNQWTQKADFGGSARSAAVAFTIDNKAYVGTGTDGAEKKDLWEFEPSANVWTSKASLPSSERQSASAFAIDGKGYVCAGITYSSGSMMTNDVYEYNPVSNTWAEKSFAESHLARTGAATFVMNNKAYLCGGSGKKDLWEYIPSTNTWTKLDDFGLSSETNRDEASAFSVKGKGFVTCGYYMVDFINTTIKNDVWVYAQPQPPKAPTDLVATGISSTAVNLTWADNSTDETKFVIEQSIEDNQHYAIRDSIFANANVINLYYNNDSTTYFYRIRAVNNAGSSGYSNEDSATTRFEKPILSAIPYSTRSITVIWSHNTLRKYKYYIERSDNDNTHFSTKDSVKNATEWIDTTLTDGTKYFYRLYVKTGNKKLYSNINYAITGKQGSWKSLANYPSYFSECFSFMIGRKLYTGTRPTYSSTNIEFYEYDADKNSWTKKSDFPGEYREYPRALMINNKGYVGVGYTLDGNQCKYFSDFWEYDPIANTWKKVADFPGTGRILPITLTINNRGYLGFGYNSNSLKDLWQYNSLNNSWSQMANCPVSLNSPTAFRVGNLGYFGFGWNGPLLYSFNPDLNNWTKKNDFTDLSIDDSKVGGQYAFNIGDKAYLIASKPNSFWEYDQQNDTWIRKNGYNNAIGPMNTNNIAGSDGSVALFHPETENSPGQINSGGSTHNFYIYDPEGIVSPTNLKIGESSKNMVQLNWFHDDPTVKFMIERFDNSKYIWKTIDSTGINIKTYIDTTIKENTFNKYRIYGKSINKVSLYSNEVVYSSGPPPILPITQVFSKYMTNYLSIAFSPSITDFADGYCLERSDELNPTIFTSIDTFTYPEQSFTDKNLEIGRLYNYRIKVYNKFGATISNIVRGRPGDVCIFNGIITTDQATIIDENGYDVDYNHCNTSKLTIYPQTSGNKINVVIDELNIYTYDTIYIYNGPFVTSPLLGKYTGKTVPDKLFCGNNPDGCITILSKTNCSWITSDYSGFKATVSSNKYFSPSHLKTIPSINNIKLVWNDNSANEDYFIIERSIGDGNNFVKIDSVSANTASYTDINVDSTMYYFYRIRLKSGNEYSGYSNILKATLLPESATDLPIKLNADKNNEIILYPNPTSDIIYLKNKRQYEIKQFRIYNSQGSIVMDSGKRNFTDAETSINISGFVPGIYTIQILFSDQTKNLRFIAQ